MLTRKEIANPLEVDFHVGNFDKIFQVRVTFNDRLKYLLGDARDNTL